MVGAVVSLACGAVTHELRTDGQGAFSFDRRGGFTGCTITAAGPGLAPSLEQPVEASANLVVRLQLPTFNETLTVRPREGEVGRSAYRSLASVSIPGPELRAVSEDTGDLIRYARARAGVISSTAGHVFVDGLPASALPPADSIDRILVDADPFSAEYADGSDGHIDLVTLAPDRKLRLRLGGSSLGAGGGSVLDPRAESGSSWWNLGATGPVPHLPLTFSLNTSLADDRRDVPIRAVVPVGVEPPPAMAAASASSGSIQLALHYSRGEATLAHVAFLEARGRQSGAGLSGVTLPEAGMSLRSDLRELRATLARRSESLTHRAGFVVSRSQSEMAANSQGLGVSVPGAWIGGGADTAATDTRGASWALKYVVGSSSSQRFWSAGVQVSRDSDSESEVANPAGRMVFASPEAHAAAQAGLGTGTWLGARGSGRTGYASTAIAPFVEAEILRSARVRFRGGLRADYQTGGGTFLSPRLSGAALVHGYTLRWGGGIFVHDWATGVLLQAVKNDRSHLDRFLVTSASLADPASGDTSGAVSIDSRLAFDLTRPRDLVLRASLERPRNGLTPGIEYTWTRSTHRLGSRRLAGPDGWIDTLESNRSARRHQLHLSLQWQGKGQRIGAHYQWTRSRDDTDGPFSFPESQGSLDAEEAPSAGVAPHELSVVGSFRLPGGVALTVIESYHSSTPYNVTSGTDPAGLGLYNFRGGRPRDSGNGAAFHSTSLYCSGRIALPFTGGKTYANVGLHVENLLDDRNYLALGSVAGSPLFGVPLSGLSGRSVRVTVSFDR